MTGDKAQALDPPPRRPEAQEAGSARAPIMHTPCYAHMPASSRSDWSTQCDNRLPLVAPDWSCTDEPISPQILGAYDLIRLAGPEVTSGHVSSVGPRSPGSGHRTGPGHLPWEILPLLESGNTET